MGTLDTHFTSSPSETDWRPLADATPSSWLQVLPHLDPVYGGVSAIVPRLARELCSREGFNARLAAFCSADERQPANLQNTGVSVWPLSRSAWAFNADLRRQLGDVVASSDGVHIHGLWESSTFIAASAARKAGVPYVLSAHGMLEPWALANKRIKKALYAAAIEHRNVAGAACLHALTHAEALDYRRFGYKGPIAIIPNGVEADASADPALFLARYPQAQGKRLLLFLGRIHYKKGVDLLMKAWGELADLHPDALLVMAGPDSEGTLAEAMQTLTDLDLQDRILFTGMLDTPMKWSVLAGASYFVLPSYSEGLSVAALEAMSMGVPLIVSQQCNLAQIAQSGAGWQVQTTVPSLARALQTALEANTAKRRLLRAEARDLASREFGWATVTERMAELYRWIAGGPAPQRLELLRGGS